MGRKSRFESKALEYVYGRYVGKDPQKARRSRKSLQTPKSRERSTTFVRKPDSPRSSLQNSPARLRRSSAGSRTPITTVIRWPCSGELHRALDKRVEIRFVSL